MRGKINYNENGTESSFPKHLEFTHMTLFIGNRFNESKEAKIFPSATEGVVFFFVVVVFCLAADHVTSLN